MYNSDTHKDVGIFLIIRSFYYEQANHKTKDVEDFGKDHRL